MPCRLFRPSEQCSTHSTWKDCSLQLLSASMMVLAAAASLWMRSMRCGTDVASHHDLRFIFNSIMLRVEPYVRRHTQILVPPAMDWSFERCVTFEERRQPLSETRSTSVRPYLH